MTESTPSTAPGYRPDLPDWGVYPRWPADDDLWIHPDDLAVATRWIPSARVFRRFRWDGTYYWLAYGEQRLRVKPSMWLSVPPLDLEVGQQVELLSKLGEHDPGVYRVQDIFYAVKRGEFEFYLRRGDLRLPRSYEREDLRPTRPRHHLRVGYYDHAVPRSQLRDDGVDPLDVGDVLGADSADKSSP